MVRYELVLVYSAMRHFAVGLAEAGFTVREHCVDRFEDEDGRGGGLRAGQGPGGTGDLVAEAEDVPPHIDRGRHAGASRGSAGMGPRGYARGETDRRRVWR